MLEKLINSCKKAIITGLILGSICFGQTSASNQTCRTYGNDNVLFNIPQDCYNRGVKCTVGSWIYTDDSNPGNHDDETWNQGVVDRLIQVSDAGYPTTESLLVGNEYLLWRNFSAETVLIDLINQTKSRTNLPVSTGETYNIWLQHPNLANACDFIGAHIHPYWEGIHINNAAQHVIDKYNLLKQTYPGKEVQILEVGWPSQGHAYGDAVPSPENQRKFLEDFTKLAKANGIKYFIFEGFDEPWKIEYGNVEPYWGVFDKNMQIKPQLAHLFLENYCLSPFGEGQSPETGVFPPHEQVLAYLDVLYPLLGDINNDRNVNINDLSILADDWLAKTAYPQTPLQSDINKDRITNLEDLSYIAESWVGE